MESVQEAYIVSTEMVLNILYAMIGFLSIGLIIASPATLTLRSGIRFGLEKLTIIDAARQLKEGNNKGWTLVKEATRLVHDRMQYCWRNSYDNYEKAFEPGYGYCQQNVCALKSLFLNVCDPASNDQYMVIKSECLSDKRKSYVVPVIFAEIIPRDDLYHTSSPGISLGLVI